MTPATVLLYNPRAPYFAMPLALLAVASELRARGHRAEIVDGRLERDPVRALLARAGDALWLGVTVLTGSPLADALAVCRRVRAARPDLPIVWGGWHPSIFPGPCASEGPVDAVVVAQGEASAVAVTERLRDGGTLHGIPGVALRGVPAAPRPFESPGAFAPHDYGLLPMEAYFRRKGIRQAEYVASQGCPFSCSFCSDPMVYRRRWAGLPPERVVAEVAALRSRYGVTDVGFQDEIFFVDGRRTLAIAEGLLASGVAVTWTAAARVEEVTRLTDAERALLRRSGLRKLVIGAESGEPEVLARIHKGIEASQILESAAALHRAEIAGHFNFIVGFPFDETPTEVETTLRTVREVMRFPRHAFALFYYAPYPGSPIFEEMARARRAELPATLDGWAAFDYVRRPGSWVSPATHRAVEDFKFYGRAARLTGVLRPLGLVARTRHARGLYAMPVERWVGNFVRRRVLGHADI